MADGVDLSKMVSMIMENPSLMAELGRVASGVGQTGDMTEDKTESDALPTAREPDEPRWGGKRERRHRLMGAIREYLSEPRAKAVDTMMNLFDIIDLVGGR